jgi:hypothetical protein
MRAQEFITEADDGGFAARAKAYYDALSQLQKLYDRAHDHPETLTADMVKQAAALAKPMGGRRRELTYGSTVGYAIDYITRKYREASFKHGTAQFTGRATTARDMAEQIALHTHGEYQYEKGTVWTTSTGRRHQDPSDYISYPDQDSYDDANAWLAQHGQQVHYREHDGQLSTAIKLGRYIVEPAGVVYGAFGDTPHTVHRLSVRPAATINQGTRQQVDITDQEAARLRDIAQTKSADNIEKFKAIAALFRGQADVQKIIDQSAKINPADKAKLDSIIAGAKNFKER